MIETEAAVCMLVLVPDPNQPQRGLLPVVICAEIGLDLGPRHVYIGLNFM